jgi:hypothetical protein
MGPPKKPCDPTREPTLTYKCIQNILKTNLRNKKESFQPHVLKQKKKTLVQETFVYKVLKAAQAATRFGTSKDNGYWTQSFTQAESKIECKQSSLVSFGNDGKTHPNIGVFAVTRLHAHQKLARYGGPNPRFVIESKLNQNDCEYVLSFVWKNKKVSVDARSPLNPRTNCATLHWTGRVNHKWSANVVVNGDGVLQVGPDDIEKGSELFINYGYDYWVSHFFDLDAAQLGTKLLEKYRNLCFIYLPDAVEQLSAEERRLHLHYWHKNELG